MTKEDTPKSILKSAKHFFSGTLLSRFTGLGREVMMASLFGVSSSVAAFWMAFRFAYLLRRILGEGALHSAFVPHFEMLREKNPSRAARFFYDLATSLTLFLLLIVVVGVGGLGGCLLFGHFSEGTNEILRLTLLLLPALVFISLYALNNSLLNCERSYFLPSVAPAFFNLIWIAAVLFLWKMPLDRAMESLAIVVVAAFAVQWGVTMPKVYLYLSRELPSKWWKSRGISGREVFAILRPFLLGVIGVTATQINTAFDAIFARIADPEGPAYLWYAIRIQQLPLALIGVGLTGALLPPISRALQKGDMEAYRRFLAFATKRILAYLFPITIGIFVLGFSGINLVYGHGEFSQKAVIETTLCLWAYGAGLIPMTFVMIFAAAFYAFKDYKAPAILSLGMIVVNIILNALFVFVFHLGAISVALATTLAAFLQMSLLGILLYKRGGVMPFKEILFLVLKLSAASFAAAATTLLFSAHYLGDATLSWIFQQNLPLIPRGLLAQLRVFTIEGLLFGGVLVGICFLLNIREIFDWAKDSSLKIRSEPSNFQ